MAFSRIDHLMINQYMRKQKRQTEKDRQTERQKGMQAETETDRDRESRYPIPSLRGFQSVDMFALPALTAVGGRLL